MSTISVKTFHGDDIRRFRVSRDIDFVSLYQLLFSLYPNLQFSIFYQDSDSPTTELFKVTCEAELRKILSFHPLVIKLFLKPNDVQKDDQLFEYILYFYDAKPGEQTEQFTFKQLLSSYSSLSEEPRYLSILGTPLFYIENLETIPFEYLAEMPPTPVTSNSSTVPTYINSLNKTTQFIDHSNEKSYLNQGEDGLQKYSI